MFISNDSFRHLDNLSPGTKSAVQLSPNQEHSMSVTIATHGKESELPHLETTNGLPNSFSKKVISSIDVIDNQNKNKKQLNDPLWKQKYRPIIDVEYDLLMNEVGRIKQNIKNEVIKLSNNFFIVKFLI